MTLQQLHDLLGKLLAKCPQAAGANVVTASESQLENGEQSSVDSVYLRTDSRIYAANESPTKCELVLEQ